MSVNLAPMFQNGVASCRWGDANQHNGNPYFGVEQAGEIDYTQLHDGHPSIKLLPGTSYNLNREIDMYTAQTKPGDRVIISCWMKTAPKNAVKTSDYDGARIGFDFGINTDVDGLPSSGNPVYNVFSATPSYATEWTSTTYIAKGWNCAFVDWGTNNWIQQKYDFIVPDKIYNNVVPNWTIKEIRPWIDARPSPADSEPTETAFAWFADAELYINPTGIRPILNVNSNPLGVPITIDGKAYTTPAVFQGS